MEFKVTLCDTNRKSFIEPEEYIGIPVKEFEDLKLENRKLREFAVDCIINLAKEGCLGEDNKICWADNKEELASQYLEQALAQGEKA